MARTTGCDVSHWQGDIDFYKMKAAGAEFVFIKASQYNWKDSKFIQNWARSKEAGLLRGPYHFADYNRPAPLQAEYFASLIGADLGELPPVLDYEMFSAWGTPDPKNNTQWIKEFVEAWPIDCPLMLYTNPANIKYNLHVHEWMLDLDLWIAHYLNLPALRTLTFAPWPKWTFWQYGTPVVGEKYGAQSKELDMNYFNGDLLELKAYSNATMGQEPPPIDPEPPVEVPCCCDVSCCDSSCCNQEELAVEHRKLQSELNLLSDRIGELE